MGLFKFKITVTLDESNVRFYRSCVILDEATIFCTKDKKKIIKFCSKYVPQSCSLIENFLYIQSVFQVKRIIEYNTFLLNVMDKGMLMQERGYTYKGKID